MSSQTIGDAKQRTVAVPRARAASDPSGAPRLPALSPVSDTERAPTLGRLAGLCGWAALLGFLGIAVGARGLIAILVKAPDWYEPTLVVLGLAGIALAVVAFLTVHYQYVPWLLLTLSSGVLLASIVVTAEAT
ncbi:MAG: hypothetical protein V7603_5984 [Micromonosporaceae bacterium]